MFSLQTEQEITNNIGAAAYGGLITLTAHAYNELLTCARSYDAIRSGHNRSGGYQPIGTIGPVQPPPRKP